jgi:hypothetical protein
VKEMLTALEVAQLLKNLTLMVVDSGLLIEFNG